MLPIKMADSFSDIVPSTKKRTSVVWDISVSEVTMKKQLFAKNVIAP